MYDRSGKYPQCRTTGCRYDRLYLLSQVSPLPVRYRHIFPVRAKRVGVFVNESKNYPDVRRPFCTGLHPASWLRIARILPFLTQQRSAPYQRHFPFHGQRPGNRFRLQGLCDYYLFDAKTSLYGGSGNQFDWNLLHRYSGMTPFLLSGGINPYSIKAIREFHHPKLAGIDINSRFETAPGKKMWNASEKFLQAIRTGETAL